MSGIAAAAKAETGYVANTLVNTVTPVDLATGVGGAEIPVGKAPTDIVITPDGRTVWVLNQTDRSVTPIDVATNTAGTPITGLEFGPTNLAISPDGKTAVAVGNSSTALNVIDLTAGTVSVVKNLGTGPSDVTVTPDGKFAYVSFSTSAAVVPVNLATKTAAPKVTGAVGGTPYAIVIAPDGKTAYIAAAGSKQVTPINLATNSAEAGIPMPISSPRTLALSPDASKLYVGSTSEAKVSVVDLATRAVTNTIATANSAVNLVSSNDGKTVWSVQYVPKALQPIDTATETAATPIGTTQQPRAMVVVPESKGVLVPTAPKNLAATLAGDKIELDWNAPADDGGSAIDHYVVTPTVDGNKGAAIATSGPGTHFDYEPVVVGSFYSFTVAAVNSAGQGGASNTASVQAGISTPGAPTGVTAEASDRAARVTWLVPSRTGGAPITGYEITVFQGGTELEKVSVDSVSAYTVEGLINGQNYSFAVAAINEKGTGPASSPSPTVTPEAPKPLILLTGGGMGATLGDPENPPGEIYVSQSDYDPSLVEVEATASSNPSVAALSGISITGSGQYRMLNVTPAGATGTTQITLKATGVEGKTATTQVTYGVSAASSTPATTRYYYGAADLSAATDVGGGYEVVANDEDNNLRLYKAGHSGFPLKEWNFSTPMLNGAEIDLEASARVGDTIYWIGSLGNKKNGDIQISRHTLFTTKVSGAGADTELTFGGYYRGLRPDLIKWDEENGNRFGFANGSKAGIPAKAINGFNVEGMEFVSGSAVSGYIGFRAPLYPPSSGGKAVVVPVTNLGDLATSGLNTTVHATFGEPLIWDLGGLSIRDMRRSKGGQYLIVAGSWSASGSQALYVWDGDPAHQPVKALTPITVGGGDDGGWEAIGQIPDQLVSGATFSLVMDQGSVDLYGTFQEAKDLSRGLQKSPVNTFTLQLPEEPQLTDVDLSTYKRVGRYDLPEPTRTSAPTGNLLAQEASGVAYNWDTDTLFVVGDGGTSVTQVTKAGALIDTMTLPPGGSDQGTEFYDTEGITYIGNNEFVMTEERYRQAVKFTYEPGGTLTRAEAKTVKLGTTIGNVGLEGVTNDPVSGGYVFAKEMEPRGIFQTGIDWNAGTATNGGPSVVNSTDLFDPALTGLIDISDVFALANLPISGPQKDNLLIISQESGKVINVNRSGNVASSLTLVTDPGNPLSIQQQTHEGVTMDDDGVLYTVNESGGGDADHPQLWVFESTGEPNQAPTGVTLTNQTTSLPENTNTSARLKLADVVVADDGIGTNTYSVTGPDASFFEADSSGLYLKAGTTLNKSVKPSYEVTVKVEDTTVSGSTPVTAPYTLTVTSAAASTESTLAVTEVAPWGSGDGAYGADWFELTNTGTKTINLSGWRMDDESANFGAAVTLNGVSSLAPGESAIFTEDDPSTVTNDFINHWFAGSPPAGFKIGSYTDVGTGLSTGGDQVNIFNPSGTRVTGVAFGASTSRRSFDNTAALGSATSPLPVISTLSTAGVNGAKTVGGETGSPGLAPVKTPVIVSEVAPWGSGNPEYGADWFELTNISPQTLDLTGWKIDDDSNSFASGTALTGVSTLAPGESAVFVEGDAAKIAAFKTSWFGSSVPASLQFGNYAGPGLGTGGDQVNIFNDVGQRLTGVAFGSATTNVSFDNAAGAGSYSSAPTISTLSADGVNGAFKIHDQIGSPGKISGPPPLPSIKITEVSSTGSSASYGADWFELTNTGATPVSLTGWKIDDDSSSFVLGTALTGVSTLAAGESAVFVEGDAAKLATFKTFWFGSSVPAGLQFGSYTGPGLGSGGDQVNIFNSEEVRVTGVRFGAATAGVSFDNAAGIGSATENPPPLISTLSAVGTNGAFTAAGGGEVGSPGTIKTAAPPLPSVKVTEVSSTSSSNSTYAADFWELTNTGSTAVDLTGWKVDDDSNSFGSAIALNGVSSLAPGESAIFIEGSASTANAFKTAWFGSSVPAGFQIGTYSGSGIGFSSGGDQVNVFNAAGTKVTGVRFGAGTSGVSFDNAAGIGSATENPPPLISTLSVKGTNGAFNSVTGGETGSPGTIKNAPPALPNVKITEVSSTSSSNSTYAADFWELTNNGSTTVNPSSWKVDDDSNSFGSALALNGVTSLAPGESAIFIEGSASTANAFKAAWFGSNVPAGFQIGTYSGSGIGFSSGGDQVNLFNAEGTKITGVRFGAGTSGVSFDNAAGIGSATENPPPLISTLSVKGTNGAFNSVTGGETGSPGTIKNPPAVAPTNSVAPNVTGTAGIGATLTCAPGTWNGTPAPSFAYQWLRDGAPIGSANATTYTTVAADGGAAIKCEVTATNSAGSAKAVSNAIQMPPAGLYCAGVAISGGGSPLQDAAHEDWATAFTTAVCPGGPAVSYTPGYEDGALVAWGADDGSGPIDHELAFIGADGAPTAAEIANIKAAAGPGTNLAVIPVAQTAIAVIANPPAGCTVEEITSNNLTAVFEGRFRNWSDLATAEGTCNSPITRVVPKDAQAVSAQFKNYLFQLNKKALACAPGKATWEQLIATDTVWPESCPERTLSSLSRPETDGAAAAAALVNSTAGAIGFATLPDATTAGAELLALQNNGFASASEATFALPNAGAAANCETMTYKRPAGGGGLDLDWSGVYGAKPAIGSNAYPLCMLTYVVAFHGYEAAGFSVGQHRTVKDYLNGLVVTNAGQAELESGGYAPVPGSPTAQLDILGEARKAAAKVTR